MRRESEVLAFFFSFRSRRVLIFSFPVPSLFLLATRRTLTALAHLPRVHRQRHDPPGPILAEAPRAVLELLDWRRRRHHGARARRRRRGLLDVRPGLPHLLRARAAPGHGLVPVIPRLEVAAPARRAAVAALTAAPVVALAAALLLALDAALARVRGENALEGLPSEVDVAEMFFIVSFDGCAREKREGERERGGEGEREERERGGVEER